VREGFGIDSEDIVVLLIGSVEPRKGQLEFLTEVAPKLPSSANPTRVILVGGTKDGDESYERACRRAAARLKAPHVTFVGYRPGVFDWLLACDLVVLPSRAEGLPRTALEAGAFSRPVVGTQIPGMADAVIDSETGFVIERENHAAFGAAIVRLADDESLRSRLGAQARVRVEQYFDIELCRQRFQEVLKGCTRD
jgi:glycosyltransferase involved in cell wall biosynthesis